MSLTSHEQQVAVTKILAENDRRNKVISQVFNPVSGEGSIGKRKKVRIKDFPLRDMWLPVEMLKVPLVKQIIKYGSIAMWLESEMDVEATNEEVHKVVEQLVRIRIEHDFAFWCAVYIYISPKGGGDDILFRLNRPQRRLVEKLEAMRTANKPIRLILLKARQWGGSTCIQLYMAWLQLVHKTGLNSIIAGLTVTVADEIQDMYTRCIERYPVSMLYDLGAAYNDNEKKWEGVGKSGNIHRVPQRRCKIKIGTAQKPDSIRGGSTSLVHCSEVGLWEKTEKKTPEQMVRSACSGILLEPLTMIVYESTANGTGNFFHKEWLAAVEGKSQFTPLFIAWYDIDQYRSTVKDYKALATWLWLNRNNRNAMSDREEPGQYLWWLWQKGATLEAIQWYIMERTKYNDHGQMASEYPSDDVEAFVHSGSMVFDRYQVEKFRKACKAPKMVGDVVGTGIKGKAALENVHFSEDRQGLLWIWQEPEIDEEEKVTNRYLVVVDIGGRSRKADWSVITVFDRLMMMDGGTPSVVAQWYGHIDMDLLAWKAAQVAKLYDDALLVIESNTLETHDRDRQVDGDQGEYILSQVKNHYENLYARKQSEEEIKEKAPIKYGFHTNRATKPMVISMLVEAIRERLYVERDERCLHEYLCYERKQNGSFGAITDEHDDLLMTRGIGLHIAYNEMPLPRIVPRTAHGRRTKRRTVSEATIG